MNISVGGCKIVFSPIAIPSEVEGFMLEWKQFRIGVTYFQKKKKNFPKMTQTQSLRNTHNIEHKMHRIFHRIRKTTI